MRQQETCAELTKKSREEAEARALALVEYWRERGYSIEARIEVLPFSEVTRCRVAVVTTDLVNGLPRDYRHPEQRLRLRMERAYGAYFGSPVARAAV